MPVENARPYRDLGATYLDGLEKRHTTQHLFRRLEQLGYEVSIARRVTATLGFVAVKCPLNFDT